jgi:hypothetical protein
MGRLSRNGEVFGCGTGCGMLDETGMAGTCDEWKDTG